MPIIFRSTPVTEPFMFESIGNHWMQDRVSRPGGFPFYHYLQTEEGTGRVDTDAGAQLLREGEGLLIAPFIRHSYESEGGGKWRVKFAAFTGTAERSIPQVMANRPLIFTDCTRGSEIGRLIDSSISLLASSPSDAMRLSVNCYAVLLNIADSSRIASQTEDRIYRDYVLPVIKEIENHYPLPLTVEELSRQVFITPQYLTRLFRRYLNCSAYEYLTSFRISKAKELLITAPRLEVQEIARRTGFTDASHFICVFKKAVGETPLGFRRMN